MVATISQIVRQAPDGTRVEVSLPPEAPQLEWHANTRFGGPGFVRNFGLAPLGQHQVIPKKIFPGGRTETFRRTGFDLYLYESADRTDSCLVWAGPHHEATTWFGGPLPRRAVLNHTLSAVSFTDSPEGATLRPAVPAMGLQQFGTFILGVSDEMVMTVKDARTARDELPEWQGAAQGDAEVWKEKLDLDGDQATELSGTPFEWRYIYANPTSIVEIVFPRRPGALRAQDGAEQERVSSILAGVRAVWAA
ncbi:hypothetical protein ACIBO5_45420 [Nonomuraea angiospora]|uniref:hypothetical protein n=1 Tax=Nonomuraea angiospora TaxID=46172 RepID=UPI0029ADB7DA|nr:hypothetical protein [Nonomuraea angiospora]MDX3104762.1 hypothetical protein [Nonomuraea angiospora]